MALNESVKYGLRTAAVFLLAVFVILTVMFVILRVAPGDPERLAMPRDPGQQEYPDGVIEEIRALFDEPLSAQYVNFIQDMLSGEFYYSFTFHTDVSDFIYDYMWRTAALFAAALLLSVTLGFLYGFLSSRVRKHVPRQVVSLVPLLLMSVSVLSVAWIGFHLTAIEGDIFPSSPFPNPGSSDDSLMVDLFGNSQLAHSILPVLIVSLVSFGALALVMRDGYRLGWSLNGCPEERPSYRSDGLFVSLPLIQLFVASLICCIIVAEYLLSFRGLGWLLIESMNRRDYFPLQASFFLIAVMVFVANIVLYVLVTALRPNKGFDMPRQECPPTGPVVSYGSTKSSAEKKGLARAALAEGSSICRDYVKSPVGLVSLAVFAALFGVALAGSQQDMAFDLARRPIPYDPSTLFLIGAVAPMTMTLLGGLLAFVLSILLGIAFGVSIRFTHALMQGVFHGIVSMPIVPFVMLIAFISEEAWHNELTVVPRLALLLSLPLVVLVANSLLLSRQRLWSMGRDPKSIAVRDSLPKVLSWSLFGLKYSLVAGLSAVVMCDFVGVTHWESWGRSLNLVFEGGLMMTSGGWDYVLPALIGISLLLSSVFLILDTLENIIRRRHGPV
ncbi:TPA: ABC transporter permease [Thermoplasmata archaeon]|nr:ABC transporter permease [Thermoplasmata archaeon]